MRLRSAQLLPDLYIRPRWCVNHSKSKNTRQKQVEIKLKHMLLTWSNAESICGLREEQKITNSRRLFSTYYCTKKCTRLLSRHNTRITAHKCRFFSHAQRSDASELYACLPVADRRRGCKSTYRLAVHLAPFTIHTRFSTLMSSTLFVD